MDVPAFRVAALEPRTTLGVTLTRLPLTLGRLWEAIQAARHGAPRA